MHTNKLWGIVVACLLIGGFVGYVAALDSPPPLEPQATQWETLVAGAAAVIGGVLAYFGATKPHREILRQSVRVYRIEVIEALKIFVDDTDPDGQLRDLVLFVCKGDQARADKMIEQRLIDQAKRSASRLRSPPPDIFSEELYDLVETVKFRLSTFNALDTRKSSYLEEIRFQCLRLIDHLDNQVINPDFTPHLRSGGSGGANR